MLLFINMKNLCALLLAFLIVQNLGCDDYEMDEINKNENRFQYVEVKQVKTQKAPLYVFLDNILIIGVNTSKDKLQGQTKDNIYLWNWHDLTEDPNIYYMQNVLGENRLNENQYIGFEWHDEEKYFVVKNLTDNMKKQRYILKNISSSGRTDSMCSRNGNYVAISFADDDVNIIRTDKKVFVYGKKYLYKYNAVTNEFSEICTIPTDDLVPNVGKLAISENGQYIAAVGLNNGAWILLADTNVKKTYWEKIDKTHSYINFNDVCFSMDGKYIYVASNPGVITYETSSGKIINQWATIDRCVGVDVSPDGRLVAGGVVPTGEVYIFEAKSGKLLTKLETGQYTMYGLAFSPDSKLLATSGVKNTGIKIWQMPDMSKDNVGEPNIIKK